MHYSTKLRYCLFCFYSIVLAASLLFTACSSPRDYFIPNSNADREQLKLLFHLLDSNSLDLNGRYATIQKISSSFIAQKNYPLLVNFLSEIVQKEPDSTYNASYLLSIAWAYSQTNANEVAALYYDRILKNYNDLIINGESIHRACLRRLITLSPDPAKRIEYRRELLSRFSDTIDMGKELFLLGNDYEAIGDWESSLEAYRRFLSSYATEVEGKPDALQYAQQFIDLATIRKDWTYETLNDLINAVSVAMANNNARALSNIRAKVGFFAMDWYQDKTDGNSQVLFDFSAFTAGSRLYRDANLDPSSNSREAFLRTWGWTERISVWYLYFRKVNFPADPEVHGRWEWAGIYFGEKLQ